MYEPKVSEGLAYKVRFKSQPMWEWMALSRESLSEEKKSSL